MFDRRKPVGKVVALPVEQIEPSPYQARRVFDQEELAGLAASIKENGLLQPVTVRRLGPDRYELIAGERRLRACKLAGMDRVPAILRDYQDDQTAALSLLENIQRADLNPFEQARGLQDVLALWGCTQAEGCQAAGDGPAHPGQQAASASAHRRPAAVHPGKSPHRAPRPGGAAAAREPPQRGPHHHQPPPDECPGRRPMLQENDIPAQKPRRLPMVRDVRIFVNTIDHAIRLMTDNGVPATARREEGDGYIEYTVRIPTGPGTGK